MLCTLILYVSGGIYRLTSTPNDRFLKNYFMAGLFYSQSFQKLFHGRFIYCQSFCHKSAERKSLKKYCFHCFVLMSDLGYERGLLPTRLRRLWGNLISKSCNWKQITAHLFVSLALFTWEQLCWRKMIVYRQEGWREWFPPATTRITGTKLIHAHF